MARVMRIDSLPKIKQPNQVLEANGEGKLSGPSRKLKGRYMTLKTMGPIVN